MIFNSKLNRLINAVAPYWAGEREVFINYWESPIRTRETDCKWIACQCSKEFWGSGLYPLDKGLFLGPLEYLIDAYPKIDQEIDRHDVLEAVQVLSTEFLHYSVFADVYDSLAESSQQKINPHLLQHSWPEDLQLAELRFAHKRENSKLGARATSFTEGGYCTLFSEGMKLKNHTEKDNPHAKANALIAVACSKVYDDEYGHMIKGIVGLEKEKLTDNEWSLLERMSIEQLKSRILMRNSQFSYPLSEIRIQELLAGKCEPIVFDYEKAKEYLTVKTDS